MCYNPQSCSDTSTRGIARADVVVSALLTVDGILVQTQGRNIRSYAEYLVQRASSFGATKIDHVRTGEGRLKRLSVEKGLLRETESVQDQIRALLRCDVSNLATGADSISKCCQYLWSRISCALFDHENIREE